jgi:hypothetical protein
VDTEVFPDEDFSSFFIQYTKEGENIKIPLSFLRGSLVIEKESVVHILNDPTHANFYLYYQEKEEINPVMLSAFNPLFIDGSELVSQLNILIEELRLDTHSKILAEAYDYIIQFYGEIEVNYLDAWLKDSLKR